MGGRHYVPCMKNALSTVLVLFVLSLVVSGCDRGGSDVLADESPKIVAPKSTLPASDRYANPGGNG